MARSAMALALLLGLLAGPGFAQGDGEPQKAPYVPTAEQTARFAAAKGRLDRWTRPVLTPFASEAEIRRWLTDAQAARRAIPRDPEAGQEIFMVEPRGRSRGSAPLIVPEPGVDRGDAVRQAGRFILVLSGNSLLVIDTGTASGQPARLADEVSLTGPWYSLHDAILLHGDHVIVTGRAGQGGASLISAFRLGADGRLRAEGVFMVSGTDDARLGLAGERLVIYSSTDNAYHGASSPDFRWPRIWRWTAETARREEALAREEERTGNTFWPRTRLERAAGAGRRLLAASDIYRPIRATFNGELHTISVCPLASLGSRTGLACRSIGFGGSANAGVMFTATNAYVTLDQGRDDSAESNPSCPGSNEGGSDRFLLYRVPLDGDSVGVTAVAGTLEGMAERNGRARLFLRNARPDCGPDLADALADLPQTAFTRAGAMAGRDAYAELEGIFGSDVLFTADTAIVFSLRDYLDEDEIALVPLDRPAAIRQLRVPHRLSRVEPVAGGALITGWAAEEQVAVTFVGPGTASRPDTIILPGLTIEPNQPYVSAWSGNLIGLPTDRSPIARNSDHVYRFAPDLHFLRIDENGRLVRAGTLTASREHECGSCSARLSRAIFMNGRIFALAGPELIEGRLENGQVIEVRRFDVAAAIAARAAGTVRTRP